ncbi:Uncharacterised protein [Mycobacteroides abscessus subsp. abscessus]|nr:Uncharacterised protein [Mycobacteroides abscessus subsp. abscessus]
MAAESVEYIAGISSSRAAAAVSRSPRSRTAPNTPTGQMKAGLVNVRPRNEADMSRTVRSRSIRGTSP